MKIFILFSLILLNSSCKQEEIEAYDSLTSAERDAIQNASRDKCISTYSPTYASFKKNSNDVFDSSSYNRELGFYHEYKAGTEVKRKMDIRVWKRDGNADEIYFYVTETQLASESYFLRITRAQNEEMIDDLLLDHCVRTPARIYESSMTSSALTVKYEFEKSNAPNTDEYIDTYSLPFTSLAMFANFRLSRKITTRASDGDVVGSAVNYTSTLTTKTYDFEGFNDATNSARYTQKFCDFQYELPAPDNQYRFSKESSFIGFKINCDTVVPAEWNLSI